MSVRIASCGDTAIVFEFGDTIDRELSRRVLQLNAAVRKASPSGVVETIPTFRSLMVQYDPLVTSAVELTDIIQPLLDTDKSSGYVPRKWRFPVCYEGDKAPDLEDVARQTSLTPNEVVKAHCGRTYHVYMIGFLPGYPYMGDLAKELNLPRRDTPRVRVPPGGVAIANAMTAIYPIESPGGWHLIGSTPVSLFDSEAQQPALLAPGDQVEFVPVPRSEFDEVAAAVSAGAYSLVVEDSS